MPPPEKSAGIIVFHQAEGADPKYLLLHYQSGHWGFPKGHMEKGETEEQTALRELFEETGLQHVFLLGGYKGNVNYYFTNKEKQPVYKEVVFFLAQSPSKTVVISDEHIGFRWLQYDTALKSITFKNEQDLLKKADEWVRTKKASYGGEFSGHSVVGSDI